MSQSESSDKTNSPLPQPNQSTTTKGNRSATRIGAMVGLALVAILALGFAGYTALNPRVSTVTQQQLLTNTVSVFNTQTQIITSVAQFTQSVTVTNNQVITANGVGSQPSYYQYCSPYGCMYAPGSSYNTYNPYQPPNPWYPGYYQGAYYGYYNGNFVQPCNPQGLNNTVTCSGYIFQAQNGCTVMVIPVANPYYAESNTYQYYTLHNLPSNTPTNGSWATVTGQLYNGSNTASNGAACPGNYINVSSVN